ncbi:MAG: hypothetical protein ACRDL6_12110 [Solirubrobacterales bacterium]
MPAALLAGLTLAACGGDDSSEDEEQITESIELAATSGDPEACTENQTQRFNDQTAAPAEGAEATRACERTAEDTPAEEIEVDNVEVDGDSATAEAAVTGSFLGGQTLEIALVKEGDQWKLDELTGFAEFDREAFVDSLVTGGEEIPPEATECLQQRIQPLSDEELQDLVLAPDPEAEQAIFARCFEGAAGGQGGAGAQDGGE